MKKIVEFQDVRGLKPDGILGKKTLLELGCFYKCNDTQIANLVGQCHIETGGFEADSENLNYKASVLVTNFSYYKKRPAEAYQDGRTSHHSADEKTIANKVYWDKNRSQKYKLGNTDWGDGWKFRGRGVIQITGKKNYELFGIYLGVDLISNPELVSTVYYWQTAKWFFDRNKLWTLANQLTVDSMTKLTAKINGGDSHLAERMKWTRYYDYIINKDN